MDDIKLCEIVALDKIREARKLIRTFPQCPLIRSDDISDRDVEKWLKNFKTEALLTP
jgi:hypothetical protein